MSRSLLVIVLASACALPGTDEARFNLSDAKTVVALTFDDTFADNYQVGAMAVARGMRATFYVNSGRIGAPGYMTRDQLLALQNAGHEIAGHTVSHARLTILSEDEMRRQVCNDRVALLDAGFSATSFAYPFSAHDATSREVVSDCGYNSARLVGGLVSGSSCAGCPHANALPPADAYQLRTNESVQTSTTLAQLQQYVIQAEQNGGGFVPLVFHHVCDGCDPLAVSPSTLATFMDWLAARGPATQVGTVHQVIGGSVQAGVLGPAPGDPPPPGSNLLRNASLEADANADQVPDCWQRGGYGTNSATYALVGDAYDGELAQRITMTSFTSGARRLVSQQDLGACAPPVIPGHRYAMSAYYTATSQPIFSVYYRTTSGGWIWFAQSARLPTSSTYTRASFTTPALPGDATAISVGLSLIGLGTLTSDAYELLDVDGVPPDEEPPPTTSDTTPPSLSIACNGTTCGTSWYRTAVSVSLTGSDAGGIREIRYTTDGSDPASGTLYTGPFSVAASATVRAIAVDNAGNPTSLGTQLLVDTEAPTARIAEPSDGATVRGITTILAAVSDNVGVYRVRFYLDGVQLGTRVQTSYRWRWDTRATTIGSHQLAVQAEDAAGNVMRSASITVNVVR